MKTPIAAIALMFLLAASCSPDPAPRQTVSGKDSPSMSERCRLLPAYAQRVRRGYVKGSSPDINVIPREPNYVGTAASPVHSGPWEYLARVPLVIYGPGFVKPGEYTTKATMADLAPTAASLIGFDGFHAPDGRALSGAISGGGTPRLLVTLVWDGGGWNVLDAHPKAHPTFDSLLGKSANFPEMRIGSSPSVTPSIHSTLSTGAFPRTHGIPGLRIRTEEGEYVDPFIGLDPSNLRSQTLADVYDRKNGNEPVVGMLAAVNWHLSMIGHGASLPGGDADPAVLFDDEGATFTNTGIYSLPAIEDRPYLVRAADELDAADGSRDGEWRGHPIDDPEVRYASPAHVAYQEHLLERLVDAEGFGADEIPDLLYVNFKSGDDAAHAWGMSSPELGETLEAEDAALRRLMRFLHERVGRDRWALMLTADHGFTRHPSESGGWPIGGGELARDANAALDETDDGVNLIDRVSSPGAYVNHDQLAANGTTLMAVARWIAGYKVGQNLKDGSDLPQAFEGREDELLFDGVVSDDRLVTKAC